MSVITDNAEIILGNQTYMVSLRELYSMSVKTNWGISRLKNYLMILKVLDWNTTADYLTRQQVEDLESKIQTQFGTFNYL